ncbi:neurturin-like [Lepus europaeus]|uniref:neurturin-like n=1 Tax=Lepus europaeus TaxID=9983 RepID=UPI002B476C88|nr:neurturin-like [Lepus europaeus]
MCTPGWRPCFVADTWRPDGECKRCTPRAECRTPRWPAAGGGAAVRGGFPEEALRVGNGNGEGGKARPEETPGGGLAALRGWGRGGKAPGASLGRGQSPASRGTPGTPAPQRHLLGTPLPRAAGCSRAVARRPGARSSLGPCTGAGPAPTIRHAWTLPSLQRWKAAALAWALCSSLLTFWMCPEGLGPALAPLRRPPRTLDARIAGLAQYRALLQGGPAPGPRLRAGPRRRRALQHSGARPCGLRELVVRVSELGLGYPSDEAALLHYCAGVCEAATRVHDLGLWRLRQQRRIQRDRVRAQPCCRPTTYEEKVSFLDVHSRYHTVRELWARECACV